MAKKVKGNRVQVIHAGHFPLHYHQEQEEHS